MPRKLTDLETREYVVEPPKETDLMTIWHPSHGEYAECRGCRQYLNGRIPLDLTTWYETPAGRYAVGGEIILLCDLCVDAAQQAIASGSPNRNGLLLPPVCVCCLTEPPVWGVDFALNDDFYLYTEGGRVEIDRFGLCTRCAGVAAKIIGYERSLQRKEQLLESVT